MVDVPNLIPKTEEQKRHEAEVLKAKQTNPLHPEGNVISTPSPIPGAAVPTANLPSIEEADKIVLKQQEEARKEKEKKDKEIEVQREKDRKLREEEDVRRAKIQEMADGKAGSVPASKIVDRYNTEDGLPPRYEAGNLEPINAKKIKTDTVQNPR